MKAKSKGWAWMHDLLETGFIILARNRNAADGERPSKTAIEGVTHLLCSSYELLIERWRKAEHQRSDENWRWKQHTKHKQKTNTEIELEYEICKLDKNAPHEWTNQMPTCSGLFVEDMSRSDVDLARFHDGQLELIELKNRSDDPEFAAREILIHGLLYLLARSNRLRFAHEITRTASRVRLSVLAPWKFYEKPKRDRRWMENLLDLGISALCRELQPGLEMQFRFTVFPKEFEWKGDKAALAAAVKNIRPLHSSHS